MSRLLGDLWRRVRAIFLRRQMDRDLEEELRMHLEMEARKHVLAGMPRDEAERRARVAFGGRTQTVEACREARGLGFAENLLRDAGYAFRSFRRSPGVPLAIVVTIALAIGANLTVFNFYRAILLDTLPVHRPSELFMATIRYPGHPEIRYFSWPDLRQMQKACDPAQITGFTDIVQVHVRDDEGTTSTLQGQLVSGNFFSTLGVTPRLGRLPDARDNQGGAEYVAAISYRLWSGKYAQNEGIIGRQLLIQQIPVTVIGVLPEGFDGVDPGEKADVWMPLPVQAGIGFHGYASMSNIDNSRPWLEQDVEWLHLLARSRDDPGGRHLQAGLDHYLRSEVDAVLPTLHDEGERRELMNARFVTGPGSGGMRDLRDRFALPLKVLLSISVLLLLCGCFNNIGLLLARSRAQEHEMALRLALGSGRRRIAAQRTTEILLLCTMGGIASLPLAWWASALIEHWLLVGQSIQIDAGTSERSIAFAIVLTFLASLLISVVPGLRGRDASLSRLAGVRAAGRGARSSRFSSSLVAAQLCLAIVLLSVTGLLVRTLLNYEYLRLGVDRSHTLSVSLDPAAAGYTTAAQLDAFYRQLTERVDRIPGVVSSSVAGCGLMNGGCAYINVTVSGAQGRPFLVERNYVGADYFSTTGMRVLEGRGLSKMDQPHSQAVAVVNRSFEKLLFAGQSAIGHIVSAEGKKALIVGTVEDARTNGIKDEPSPFIFLPISQAGAWDISHLEIRTESNPDELASAVRAAVSEINRGIPVAEIVSLGQEADRGLARELLMGRLAGIFSVLAVLIAAVGLYGLMNYEVTRRRGEFAIRMAVGATRKGILTDVFERSLRTLVVGCAAGLLVALGVSRIIGSLLFEVSRYDPRIYAGSVVAMLLVVVAAVWLPAWRAASADPAAVLRSE